MPTAPTPSQPTHIDMPLEGWMKIFLAFIVEHLRAFPKDALCIPGHMDLIIKMKVGAMQWKKYGMLVRQKREKWIARGFQNVGSWSATDVVLYLKCQ